MNGIKHILIAVDEFPQSTPALSRAFELGQAHSAKVTVVHISDQPGLKYADVANKDLLEEQALRLARDRVEDAIRTLGPGGITVDVHIEAGSAFTRVVEIASDLDVDLIVLAAHQRDSIREKLIGSTADRIIRATPSSVLVVKRSVERPYRHAVVAVDFTESSESAAILASDTLPGVGLQLVHATHVSSRFEQILREAGSSQAKIVTFRQLLVDQAGDRLERLAKRFAPRKPAPGTRVVKGNAARTLVQLTHDPNVDLMTVGPYKHGAIRLALLGSVTQRLLREAACDILICRPHSVEAA